MKGVYNNTSASREWDCLQEYQLPHCHCPSSPLEESADSALSSSSDPALISCAEGLSPTACVCTLVESH